MYNFDDNLLAVPSTQKLTRSQKREEARQAVQQQIVDTDTIRVKEAGDFEASRHADTSLQMAWRLAKDIELQLVVIPWAGSFVS